MPFFYPEEVGALQLSTNKLACSMKKLISLRNEVL